MMVDRPVLQDWMGQVQTQLGPGSQARGMRPAAKVAVAVLGCAAIVLAVTFQVAGSPRSAAAVRVRPSAVPAPGSVVREYFAAISSTTGRRCGSSEERISGPGRTPLMPG